jgi:hypothetical protein
MSAGSNIDTDDSPRASAPSGHDWPITMPIDLDGVAIGAVIGGEEGEPSASSLDSLPPGGDGDATPGPSPMDRIPDYPVPSSLSEDAERMDWDEGRPFAENARELGRKLRRSGDLYRGPYAGGLILASRHPSVPPMPIQDRTLMGAIIADRLNLTRLKDNKPRGTTLPASVHSVLLRSESFLQQFQPIDEIIYSPLFLSPDFDLTAPGYHDGGPGQRLLFVGETARVKMGHDRIDRFLDAMCFPTEADRTGAVAAALTVLLHHHWPGGKPILVVTSDKSHAGKDTLIQFASGTSRQVSISYQATDWALERALVGALNHDRSIVVVTIENARLDGVPYLRSAFLERLATDPEPLLYSTAMRRPIRCRNGFILAISMNHGKFGEDVLNRSLPIHLSPVGDVASRRSPIGNPKLEYLPAHREEIAAEVRGMVVRWRESGRPLDESVRHPFTEWARVVGGILQVNGFTQFLGNYQARRTTQDPLREAIGRLGATTIDDRARSQNRFMRQYA